MDFLKWVYSKEFMLELFNPKGRWNRKKFWLYQFALIIPVYLGLIILAMLLGNLVPQLILILALVGYIAIIVVSVCSGIKRLRDLDKNPWMYLLILVPFANIYIFVITGFFKGTTGKNQYGPDPLGGTTEAKVEL